MAPAEVSLCASLLVVEGAGLTWHWAQALVQFPDEMIAEAAKQVLEGHAVYDGGFNRVSSNRQ